MTFGQKLVVLRTTPSMFGRFLVDAWRQCGGLIKEHSLSVRCSSNSFWHSKRCLNEIGPQ
jgi:hypothetical protein